MKPTTLLPLLLTLVSSILAKSNNTSTTSQCHQIAKLTSLIALASNTTALEAKTHNNATKASSIQSKASAAATTLATLQSNTTLLAACDIISAAEATEDSCAELATLEKLTALVANTTALDAKAKGNTTRADALKAKVDAEAGTLASLQGNGTLTTICAALRTEGECKEMVKLQRTVDRAGNGTGTGKAGRVEEAAARLAVLMGNETLVGVCGGVADGVTTAAQAAGSATASGAGGGKDGFRGAGSLVAFVGVFVSAMLVL